MALGSTKSIQPASHRTSEVYEYKIMEVLDFLGIKWDPTTHDISFSKNRESAHLVVNLKARDDPERRI